MSNTKYTPTTAPLSPELRVALAALIAEKGELEAMRVFRLSRIAIARAAAGFPLHIGTRRAVASGLRVRYDGNF